jgi:diguanylate cyclase
MQATIKSLLEQMRITETAISQRMELLGFSERDAALLAAFAPVIAENLDSLVDAFYRVQLSTPEIALLIGDLDTFQRLQIAQRRYVLDLFSGAYGLEYANNRLRVGMVHKRIGVQPKLYLSATLLLKTMLIDLIRENAANRAAADATAIALDKLFHFDITLIVETYIRSMLSEIETEKQRSEQYAQELEDRSHQLENLSRLDPLTGLLNRRSLSGLLADDLVAARSQSKPLSLVYIDVDQFKAINDKGGHKYGDDVLKTIGEIVLATARRGDTGFRVGGDEFCIVLPHCDKAAAERGFCSRFRNKLHERLPDVRVSIGIHTSGPSNHLTALELIELADAAMFTTKRDTSRTPTPSDLTTPPHESKVVYPIASLSAVRKSE